MPIIDMQELGNLLTAHWTRYLNPQSVLAEVVRRVRESDLPVVKAEKIRKPALEVKISLCDPGPEGLTLWAEFNVPRGQTQVAVGTLELLISWSSEVRGGKVIGRSYEVS